VNGKPSRSRTTRFQGWAATAAVLALCWTGGARAQSQSAPEPAKLNVANTPLPTPKTAAPAAKDGGDAGVVQTGCSACSNGLFGGGPPADVGGPGGCAACGCSGGTCVPGRLNCCSICDGNTFIGRCLCGLYECVCCPDPCYEPCWLPQANAAFFVDSARPVTQLRIRWDSVLNYTFPDRSEFFWGRIGVKGPANPEVGLRYNQLNLYSETAIEGKASIIVNIPYLSVDPDINNHAAGFGDMVIGAKTLIFDCELLQVATQFLTYLPVGNFNRGLGTGHVSLEPSLLATLKLTRDTYLQGQISEWIPIGGDTTYQGSILHYHLSLDQVLWRILPDVPLIGTLEFNGYSFQDGAFTDPVLGPFQKSSGDTYLSLGPGIRMDICKKIDFGIGTAFAVGDHHGPEQTYRFEFRWRF
jgi:hypothetical protein